MKKGYVYLIAVLALMVLLMLIPAKRQASETVTIACPPEAVTRFIVFTQQWKNWWPGQQTGDSTFTYQSKPYTLKTLLLNGFYAVAADGQSSIELSFVPEINNQTQLTVISTTLLTFNPLSRISQLFLQEHKKVAKEFSKHCQAFFNNTSKFIVAKYCNDPYVFGFFKIMNCLLCFKKKYEGGAGGWPVSPEYVIG